MFLRIGISGGTEGYQQIQSLFHQELPPRHELFNEFHALLVSRAGNQTLQVMAEMLNEIFERSVAEISRSSPDSFRP